MFYVKEQNMADITKDDVKLVQSLQELRETMVEGKPSSEVLPRIYSDKYDANDPNQDCANLIYHFDYDEAEVLKVVQPKYDEIHAKYLAIIQENEKSIELLKMKIDELKLDHASLNDSKASVESLEVAYKTILEVANQRCKLSRDLILKAIENIRLDMKEELERAEAFANVAITKMPAHEASFFATYLKNKRILMLTPSIIERIDKIEKEFDVTIADREKVIKEYLSSLASHIDVTSLSKDLLANNELYAVDLRTAFVKVKSEVLNDANVARIIVFLGKEKKSVEKASKKMNTFKVTHEGVKSRLEPQLTLEELEYEKRIAQIKAKQDAVNSSYEESLNKLNPIKEKWIALNKEKLQSSEVLSTFDKACSDHKVDLEKELEETSKKFEQTVADLRAKLVEESDRSNIVQKQEEFEKYFENSYVEIKEEKFKAKSQAKAKIKEFKNLAKDLKELNKNYNENRTKNYVSTNSRVYADIVAALKNKLSSIKLAYDKFAKKVLDSVSTLDKENSSSLRLFYEAKLALLAYERYESELKAGREIELKICEEKDVVATGTVKHKYNAKMDFVNNMMKVRKVGVALGRAVNSVKMIDTEYHKLASLQNRTKLVQKSFDEALTGCNVTYTNNTEEVNLKYDEFEKRLMVARTYDNNVIESGKEYASLYKKAQVKNIKAKEKFEQQKETEDTVYNAKKNTLIHTERAWEGKCFNEEKNLKEKSQAVVNTQYLKDADAIRVRRFSAKYTLKRMFIRIFCIVAICTTLGLIQLVLKNPLIGFIVGVALAIVVELIIYFCSRITYLMPEKNTLTLYSSRGELLFILTANDIVNEVMFTKRKALGKISKNLLGFEVIVESGADVFRFAVQDKKYKKLLLDIYSRYTVKLKQEKAEYYKELKSEDKSEVKKARTAKAKKL